MDGVENAAANSVNGKGGGDVATNGTPFWLTVDLKEVKNVNRVCYDLSPKPNATIEWE